MKPDDGRPLALIWFVPLQTCLGLLMVGLTIWAAATGWEWFNWLTLAGGLGTLLGAWIEFRRARRRGRRW